MTTFAQLDRARDRHRAVATRALLAVAVLVPSCVLFLQAWNNERADLDALAGQQHGVAYVRALQPLIGAVVAAESTAVAGGTVNLQPVDRAALAVAAVDQRYGADLRTQVLWADADTRIQQLHSRSIAAPSDSFAAYSGVTGLLLELADKVGSTAGLSHNEHPELAALLDGAAHQLPAVVVAAGAHADLLLLGGTDPSASGVVVGPDAVAGTPAGSIAEQLADQRASIEQGAGNLVDDIQNASDASPDAAISESTLSKLDQFRIEVDGLVGDGTAASAGAARSGGAGLSGARAAARKAADDAATIQAGANTLAASILQSVDSLLATRVDHSKLVRSLTIGVGALAVVIALTPLLLAAVRRRHIDDEPVVDVVPDKPAPPARLSPPREFDPPVYGDGTPLPRRRPAVAAAPTSAPDGGRELMPAGVMHHRRSATGTSNTRPTGTDVAIPADDWGRSGVAR